MLVSSGYDNSDGKGYVFVLDAATGKADQAIATSCTTANGLCGIAKIGPLFKEKNIDMTQIQIRKPSKDRAGSD